MLLKIILAMVAFAANSLLCRLALKGLHMDAVSFSSVRLLSGAIALFLLLQLPALKKKPEFNWLNACLLALYVFAFSIAYVSMGAAMGALLLFGTVQLVMAGWGFMRGERLTPLKAVGIVAAGAITAAWRSASPAHRGVDDDRIRHRLGVVLHHRETGTKCRRRHRRKFYTGRADCAGRVSAERNANPYGCERIDAGGHLGGTGVRRCLFAMVFSAANAQPRDGKHATTQRSLSGGVRWNGVSGRSAHRPYADLYRCDLVGDWVGYLCRSQPKH